MQMKTEPRSIQIKIGQPRNIKIEVYRLGASSTQVIQHVEASKNGQQHHNEGAKS